LRPFDCVSSTERVTVSWKRALDAIAVLGHGGHPAIVKARPSRVRRRLAGPPTAQRAGAQTAHNLRQYSLWHRGHGAAFFNERFFAFDRGSA
jgi:hypothetical protein